MKVNRVSRRVAGLCVVGLVAGLTTAPAASAKEGKADDDVLTTFESIVVQGLVGFDTRTGKTIDLSPAKVVNNLVDAVSGEVLGKGTTRFSMKDDPTSDLRSCVESTDRKGLTAYQPINRYLSSDQGSIQFQYHPYRLEKARRLNGRGASTQWEVCSKGGGRFDGVRLRRIGTGMALNNAEEPRRIGYAWQTGKTPEDYSLELGFEVEKGPVSIGASMSQHPSDKLLGSFRGPFKTFMDAHEFDAVNAWWQDNCIGRWYRCWRNSGSHDFQGAIAHGLWEFPKGTEPAVVSFYLTPYADF